MKLEVHVMTIIMELLVILIALKLEVYLNDTNYGSTSNFNSLELEEHVMTIIVELLVY